MKYQQYLNQFKNKRILVVGELLFDCYLKGTSTRICREAPVPIVDVSEQECAPGGAANTAVNIASLGANTCFLSVAGDDDEAQQVISVMQQYHIDTRGIFLDSTRRTLTKKRVLSDHQLLLRYDYGTTTPITGTFEDDLIDYLESNYSIFDAIIASDYGYGIFTNRVLDTIRSLQKKYNKTLVVDSKGLERFQDIPITAIKPNYSQTIKLLNIEKKTDQRLRQMAEYGSQVFDKVQTRIAALTVDIEGSVIFEKGKKPFRTKTKPMPNSNASGAGDTFVSALTMALTAGATTKEAAHIATRAAAIVVQSDGTSRCTLEELQSTFVQKRKIIRLEEDIRAIADSYHAEGKEIIFTNGCFDVLHKGHITFLKEAKKRGDVLIVGLNSDSSVAQVTGSKPFNTLQDRIDVLQEIVDIDHIIPFDEVTPIHLIELIKPQVFVKGGNYHNKPIDEESAVFAYGGTIKILDFYPPSDIHYWGNKLGKPILHSFLL